MKTIGIIAEYNPFHNGHAYQIRQIRKQTGADYVAIVMSGDFVQRGAPAILDKYARTQMALSCGADLIVELPVLWALSSAEGFATAGITLLDHMGCVDAVCFGAETDSLSALTTVADILTEEPLCYRLALSGALKQGLSFPQARLLALKETGICALPDDMLTHILKQPNNILAIEYLKALRRRNSQMVPLLLKREGAGYHDALTHPANTCGASDPTAAQDQTADIVSCDAPACASATAIRNLLLTNVPLLPLTHELKRTMPKPVYDILTDYCRSFPLLDTDDFSALLQYRLLLESPCGLERFSDISFDISNRILKNRHEYLSFTQFCDRVKSRNTTYTRMSRILMHILLDLTDEAVLAGKALDYIPYIRILGFRKASLPLLSSLKRHSDIPVISKLADADGMLGAGERAMLHQDVMSAELYEQILSYKKRTFPRSEYARNIVLL